MVHLLTVAPLVIYVAPIAVPMPKDLLSWASSPLSGSGVVYVRSTDLVLRSDLDNGKFDVQKQFSVLTVTIALVQRDTGVPNLDGVTVPDYADPTTYGTKIAEAEKDVDGARSDQNTHIARLPWIRADANKRFVEALYKWLGLKKKLAMLDRTYVPPFKAAVKAAIEEMKGVVGYVNGQKGKHTPYEQIAPEVVDLNEGIKKLDDLSN
ncbi:hypothetical protein H0H93_001254 [Arthromyces matolae]|nr:hypothetical protein H0H93_001254 [Arthromyces matolae]